MKILILFTALIGLNPILFAMDEAFHCKVPVSGLKPKIEAQQPTQQETKKTQAELDAAQFAKERESKRRSALQNALASQEKPDFQLCKTALLCKKKLPAPLQRYVCSYLDKQFYLDRSFKAHNNAFKKLITYTKADGSWYIIALTIDNIVAKIDGATGEVLRVIDKFSNISNTRASLLCVASQVDDKRLVFIETRDRNYDNQRIHIYDEEFEVVEENDDLIKKYYELKDDQTFLSAYRNGNKFYDAYKGFPYQEDPCATMIIAKYQVPEIGNSYEKWRNRTELMRKKISCPLDMPPNYSAHTLHIKPNGTANLICTNMNGQMSIISEGPEIFEQCLTNNFIPSLELPLPLPMDEDHLRQWSDNRAPIKRNLSTFSQLKQMAIGSIIAAGAVGAGIAFMKYLKR